MKGNCLPSPIDTQLLLELYFIFQVLANIFSYSLPIRDLFETALSKFSLVDSWDFADVCIHFYLFILQF